MDGFRRMGNKLRSGIVSLAYRRLRRFGGGMRSGAMIGGAPCQTSQSADRLSAFALRFALQEGKGEFIGAHTN
jgi:hypothetical protein